MKFLSDYSIILFPHSIRARSNISTRSPMYSSKAKKPTKKEHPLFCQSRQKNKTLPQDPKKTSPDKPHTSNQKYQLIAHLSKATASIRVKHLSFACQHPQIQIESQFRHWVANRRPRSSHATSSFKAYNLNQDSSIVSVGVSTPVQLLITPTRLAITV